MKVLIIGAGGREHAIGLKLSASPLRPSLIFAPGNPGMEALGQCYPIPIEDHAGLADLACAHKVELTIIGPEQPLVEGIVDCFLARGLKVFGPDKAAARLEGSKAFSKEFMRRHSIPTAAYRTFTELEPALDYVRSADTPIVIKADGLAAGKGVMVCTTPADAEAALRSMLGPGAVFGAAGTQVVIEEFMDGEEVSVFALTDGDAFVILPTAQDHKRIGDGETGPNTGGMGAYSPSRIMSRELLAQTADKIIRPTLAGMRAEGCPFRGILFVGLMISRGVAKVVEYNCRFGDPETQAVLPVLKEDLLGLILASLDGTLAGISLAEPDAYAAVVVMAARGYPGPIEKGVPISGLDRVGSTGEAYVLHGGTARAGETLVTAGGRVLGITGVGRDLRSAIASAYEGVAVTKFPGAQYRKDIGKKGLPAD